MKNLGALCGSELIVHREKRIPLSSIQGQSIRAYRKRKEATNKLECLTVLALIKLVEGKKTRSQFGLGIFMENAKVKEKLIKIYD